jgi:HAD superfamily hydrolase (TIGR01509 family)
MKLAAFDLEGVLFDWREGLKAISNETSIPAAEIREFILLNLKDLEKGSLDPKIFWLNFINKYKLDKTPQAIYNSWILNQGKLNENWELARKYKREGIKIAICSNSWTGLLKIFTQNYPEFEIFDFIFDSSRLGFIKPQREFFEIVEKQTGFHGKEILLIDDSVENITGAKNFGWETKLFNS